MSVREKPRILTCSFCVIMLCCSFCKQALTTYEYMYSFCDMFIILALFFLLSLPYFQTNFLVEINRFVFLIRNKCIFVHFWYFSFFLWTNLNGDYGKFQFLFIKSYKPEMIIYSKRKVTRQGCVQLIGSTPGCGGSNSGSIPSILSNIVHKVKISGTIKRVLKKNNIIFLNSVVKRAFLIQDSALSLCGSVYLYLLLFFYILPLLFLYFVV